MSCDASEDREKNRKPKAKTDSNRNEADQVFGVSLRRLYDDALKEPLPKDMKTLLDKLK